MFYIFPRALLNSTFNGYSGNTSKFLSSQKFSHFNDFSRLPINDITIQRYDIWLHCLRCLVLRCLRYFYEYKIYAQNTIYIIKSFSQFVVLLLPLSNFRPHLTWVIFPPYTDKGYGDGGNSYICMRNKVKSIRYNINLRLWRVSHVSQRRLFVSLSLVSLSLSFWVTIGNINRFRQQSPQDVYVTYLKLNADVQIEWGRERDRNSIERAKAKPKLVERNYLIWYISII